MVLSSRELLEARRCTDYTVIELTTLDNKDVVKLSWISNDAIARFGIPEFIGPEKYVAVRNLKDGILTYLYKEEMELGAKRRTWSG